MAKKAKSAPKTSTSSNKKSPPKAAAKTASKTVQKSGPKADQKSLLKTAAKSVQKTAQKSAAKPVEKTAAKPAEKSAQKSPAAKKAPPEIAPSKDAKDVKGQSKAAARTGAAPVAVAKSNESKPSSKTPLKMSAKPSSKAPSEKPGKTLAKAKAPVREEDEELAADMAEIDMGDEADLAIVEEEAAAEAEEAAEPAAEPAEKAAEKKTKRKDELKIDRNGNLEQQWRLLFERSKALKPVPYKMSENYEAKTALMHKVLGWGYVLSSQNNRLEVLFKEGIKMLIANYKAS
jgi:hypothetical protein